MIHIPSYVLITAARNEQTHISATIESVLSQTLLPQSWVIVSDQSTDRTDEIIRQYQCASPLIQYRRLAHSNDWSFASKARAVNYGYREIAQHTFDFMGILDADVTFEQHYYASMLDRFQLYPQLGIAGGIIAERHNDEFRTLQYNMKSVAGPVQLFRRKCFDDIGGYVVSKHGGIDAIAEIMSRMRGWEIRTFPDIIVYHHRRFGMTTENVIKSRFRYGQRDYCMGTHPAFMWIKCLDRCREVPYFVGAMAMLLGFLWSSAIREERSVPDTVVRYLRKEQWSRMVSTLWRKDP